MTANPSPRRALRKAPDATVHPAAPVASEGPSVTPVAATSSLLVRRPVVELRPVLGIGGSTSDVLRKAPKQRVAGKKVGAKKTGGKKSGGKKAGAKKDDSSAKATKGQRKRHERRVDLRVKVPKEVRHELRQNAKARGTSVDDVVTIVLEGWIDG